MARVEAKGRMTFPILAMMAVRTRRSCPQQGVEGDWQPSEEGGCGGEMLPIIGKSHGSSDWVTCQWKLITPFWCSVRTPSPCLSSMCRQDIVFEDCRLGRTWPRSQTLFQTPSLPLTICELEHILTLLILKMAIIFTRSL